MNPQSPENNELDSLEDPSTIIENQAGSLEGNTPVSAPGNEGQLPTPGTAVVNSTLPTPAAPTHPPKQKQSFKRLSALFHHINIYLLIFILVIIISTVVAFVVYRNSRQQTTKTTTTNESLNDEVLQQLKDTETTVGDPKQILKVEANTVFGGKVLIKDTLDVAGALHVGGALNLSDLTITGTTTTNKIVANSLGVSGDTSVNGQLSVQKNLSVSGGASIGGALSAGSLNINTLSVSNNLQVNGHIDAGGGTPGRSNGSALGSGGTSSISGTDTAGTVSINTGSSAPAGCFTTVTFTKRFSGTPHVIITPVGSSGGSIDYYVNRTSTSFSICTSTAPGSGKSFSFDYFVID